MDPLRDDDEDDDDTDDDEDDDVVPRVSFLYLAVCPVIPDFCGRSCESPEATDFDDLPRLACSEHIDRNSSNKGVKFITVILNEGV